MIYREIYIRDQFEGFHKYENAPKEVAFLKSLHRHIFKVMASIQVFEQDREIEYFMAQKILKQCITEVQTSRPFLGSCEWIAEEILKGLKNHYGDHRDYVVEISEDGENGSSVTYTPDRTT